MAVQAQKQTRTTEAGPALKQARTSEADPALWLLRRSFRLARWLLLAAAALPAWPLAIVTVAGCAAAWLRGWPASRLGRQAGWTLPMTAVWIAAESARGWRALTLDPVRDGASGWPHLTALTVIRTFLLVAPVTIPAGLALAALMWAWRINAVTNPPPNSPAKPATGLGRRPAAGRAARPAPRVRTRPRPGSPGREATPQRRPRTGGAPVSGGNPPRMAGDPAEVPGAGAEAMRVSWSVRHLPGRIRRGRPLRLLARALAACLLALAVLHLVAGQPAAPALATGVALWFLLTARSDLAPPPER